MSRDGPPVCRYFLEGRCAYGDRCRYAHPLQGPRQQTAAAAGMRSQWQQSAAHYAERHGGGQQEGNPGAGDRHANLQAPSAGWGSGQASTALFGAGSSGSQQGSDHAQAGGYDKYGSSGYAYDDHGYGGYGGGSGGPSWQQGGWGDGGGGGDRQQEGEGDWQQEGEDGCFDDEDAARIEAFLLEQEQAAGEWEGASEATSSWQQADDDQWSGYGGDATPTSQRSWQPRQQQAGGGGSSGAGASSSSPAEALGRSFQGLSVNAKAWTGGQSDRTSNAAAAAALADAAADGLTLCQVCGKHVLDPTDEQQRSEHIAQCTARHERVQARQASVDVECGICLERVMEKQPPAARKFGLLACEHPFCLGCIRGWRETSDTSASGDMARTCPLCREGSHFVTPSAVWPTSAKQKEEIVGAYKAKLATIDCKHFAQGEGTCPFGSSCFYRHAYPDGTLWEPSLRKIGTSEGDVKIVQPVRLSQFIEASGALGAEC